MVWAPLPIELFQHVRYLATTAHLCAACVSIDHGIGLCCSAPNHKRYNQDTLNLTHYSPRFVSRSKWFLFSIGKHYLHGQGNCHRDLKPANIVLNFGQPVKICDFGWAIEATPDERFQTRCGTPGYQSPEILQGNYNGYVTFSDLSDSWPIDSDNIGDRATAAGMLDMGYTGHIMAV